MRNILISDTLRLLDQGVALCDSIDDELYGKPEPVVSSSGIGSHLRHCIDYFDRFLEGLAGGRLDYDQRKRDPLLETNRLHARRKLRSLASACRGLASCDRTELRVKQDCASETADAPWTASSVERELQFLMSHTVHHFALIAVILRLNGLEPADGFGVAPSTLRYWKEAGLVHRHVDPRR
jgi:uncharacterized damage-inducible protein DinB